MMKWWGWGSVGKEYPVQDKPDLFPFMKKMCGIDESTLTPPIRREEILLAPPRLNEAFLKDLKTSFRADQYASDDETRLLHTYGKSYRDLLRVRAGKIERSPDGVLYPENHQEVISLMKLADQHGIPLVTFGGGSNIVGGVEVDPRLEGMAITVDLQRMKNILSFDPSSRSATIEGGILGPELEAKLNARGFSLGHFPDSFEFSTLGGWLATRSAGMQSDRYGKIEDMVLSLKLVSPAGVLETPLVPKASTGPDLNQVVVGLEGTLGVITQATFRLHPLPHGKRTLTILPRRIGEAQALLLALQDANLSHAALQLRCGASVAPELDILLEGTEAGMEAQAARIRSIARPAAVKEGSEAVWKTREEIAGQDAVSKFSVLPSQIADAIAAIGRAGDGSWRAVAQTTGIGWASVKAPLEDVRAQLEGEGGTLTVLHQPAGGTPIEAWGDAGDTLPLMREIKRRFDPHNTLNPGRFVGGI